MDLVSDGNHREPVPRNREIRNVLPAPVPQAFDGRDGAGCLLATGSADGPPVQTSLGHSDNFFPEVRYGYYQHPGNTDWLMGFRFSYSYLGAK